MSGSNRLESLVHRRDETSLEIDNPHGVPITLFANRDVPVELDAVEQALGFVSLQGTVEEIWSWEKAGRTAPFWGEAAGKLERVVLTPDFHRGSGIPVGTVAEAERFIVPQAVGKDVCCGMRLLVTDVKRDELVRHLDALEGPLRSVFFKGQRGIPMSPRQRESLLKEGLWGLFETREDNQDTGIWRYYDPRAQERDLSHVHFQGILPAQGVFAFADYIRGSGAIDSRDGQIGSVGGGNHFVELQVVDEILDGTTAHAWGVVQDRIAIMAHSGSVGLGHAVGGHFLDEAKAIFPREMKRPDHGFYVIPTTGPNQELAAKYLDAMHNAANFAFGNRLFLGLMAVRVLSEVLGRTVEARLVYDAPHNLIWEKETGKETHVHRKGACPAPGPDLATAGPFRFTGHPVIIPGSMGAASYLLAGSGSDASLRSACHGAGRSLSRGKSRNVDEATYTDTFSRLRIVTPIDPRAADIRLRRDILAQYHERLKEEAPYAYKDVTPVVQTVEDAGVARRVARLWPLLTIKG
jgi:tRNA-splicing ligase RtcB (3'-phosphate/5'-hydroxy nucleic acid ligase)